MPGLGRGLDTLIPRKKTPTTSDSVSSSSSDVPVTPVLPVSPVMPRQHSAAPMRSAIETPVIPSESSEGVKEVLIDTIVFNPHQPRRDFAPEQLATLKASIAEHGLLQPIVVSPRADGTYLLIAGERRLRSITALGWTKVPAVIKETKQEDHAHHLELALIENLQRENLNPIEEALAYTRLQDEFGLSHDQISEKVKKDRATIANTIRLLKLPVEMQDALRDGRLSAGHARALLGIQDPARQAAVFHQIVDGKLSVREAESIVQGIAVRPHVRTRTGQVDGQLADWQEQLQTRFKTKVRVTRTRKGGRVVIEAFSPEELQSLITALSE